MRFFPLILITLAAAGYTVSDTGSPIRGTAMTWPPELKVDMPLRQSFTSRTTILTEPVTILRGHSAPVKQATACTLPDGARELPVELATLSKYGDGAIANGQSITAGSVRARSIDPIWRSIRKLEIIAAQQGRRCALGQIAQWASNKALTVASTADAQATRARMIAEIATLAVDYSSDVDVPTGERRIVSQWLVNIGQDTDHFFSDVAGPKTRRNNHRYWGGLAFAQIGRLSGDHRFVDKAEDAYHVGVCQIDHRGILPLELDRGTYARNYHAYALRPLVATRMILASLGRPVDQYCPGAIDRLIATTATAIGDTAMFERLTGMPQAPLPRETSYVDALRFDRLAAF